jgi:tetratricopeptide (TPR) repeat protein
VSQRLEQLRKLVAIAPNDPMSHYGVGLELVNLQRWGEAAESFGRAIEADAKYSAAYYHKGRAEIEAGQAGAARATLTRGMEVARGGGDWKTEGEMRELLATLEP